MLRDKGFVDIEDLGIAELVNRFSPALGQGVRSGPGGHVVRASR